MFTRDSCVIFGMSLVTYTTESLSIQETGGREKGKKGKKKRKGKGKERKARIIYFKFYKVLCPK